MPPPSSSHHDDGLPGYLSRLTEVPLLRAEEERELARAAQAGDARAKDRLVEANMRLVIKVARAYQSRQIPMEDLVQEGAIGLMQAVDRYDPDRGFRFSTYASHWIRQAIGRAIDNKAKAIRLPAHVAQTIRRIDKVRMTLANETGSEPSLEQLAVAVGVTPIKLQSLLAASHEMLSLEMAVGENGTSTLGSLLRDFSAQNAEEHVLAQEIVDELRHIILGLNERERRIIQARFPLNGGEPASGSEIGRDLSMTHERLRVMEAQAIRKLRTIVQYRRLGDLFGRELPEIIESDTPE